MSKPDWQALIREKRSFRESRIPLEWRLDEKITSQAHRGNPISAFDVLDQTNILTKREREITENYDATALLGQLASGAISSLEVTTAFCKRAAIAHQLVCAVPVTPTFLGADTAEVQPLDRDPLR